METFYVFTWGRANAGAPKGGRNQNGDKPRGKGKNAGKPRKGGARSDKGGKAQKFSAKPPRKEKKIDPDNPFAAALMGLKDDK
jgi:ATP-dependent RNA helicase SUPV3L1/SUV3